MKNFLKLITPFFYGEERLYARWGGFVLLVLSLINTSFGYLFIQWNRRFYDALEAKNSDLFLKESLIFATLAVVFVIVSSSSRYVAQKYALRWRMWMTTTALKSWINSATRGELEGADQRIQEDLMRFTTIFERLFLECFNSVLLILLFTPMLWSQTGQLYSGNINVAWGLCLTGVLYTIVGMYISAKIANPMIEYEYDNQKVEAEFRYQLVHVRDGAVRDLSFFDSILANITSNYNRTFNRHKYFNIWQKAYDQVAFLIPFAFLASNYFAGLLTLGMLMQIKSTFSRIRNSMAYLLDNYTQITELIAIAQRLSEFYYAAGIFTIQPQVPEKLLTFRFGRL